MDTYLVAATAADLPAEGIEVMASSPREAADRYESMGHHVAQNGDGSRYVHVLGPCGDGEEIELEWAGEAFIALGEDCEGDCDCADDDVEFS